MPMEHTTSTSGKVKSILKAYVTHRFKSNIRSNPDDVLFRKGLDMQAK